MANLNSAAEKLVRKTQGKGGFWKSQTMAATGRFCQRFGEFLGFNPGPMCTSYSSGVSAASAADWERGMAGAAEKYRAGMIRAAGGGGAPSSY